MVLKHFPFPREAGRFCRVLVIRACWSPGFSLALLALGKSSWQPPAVPLASADPHLGCCERPLRRNAHSDADSSSRLSARPGEEGEADAKVSGRRAVSGSLGRYPIVAPDLPVLKNYLNACSNNGSPILAEPVRRRI